MYFRKRIFPIWGISVLLMLKSCRTQSPQGNSPSLEGAGMGSHKTCHFPNISPKHLRSRSPCGIDPWVPRVHREKGTAIFLWETTGLLLAKDRCLLQEWSGGVGMGMAVTQPPSFQDQSWQVCSMPSVPQGLRLSELCCKDAVLQSINVL